MNATSNGYTHTITDAMDEAWRFLAHAQAAAEELKCCEPGSEMDKETRAKLRGEIRSAVKQLSIAEELAARSA